jgi:hypothetical protein
LAITKHGTQAWQTQVHHLQAGLQAAGSAQHERWTPISQTSKV